MKPAITIRGWVTRDSDDYIIFHEQKPYPIVTEETSYRDPAKPTIKKERVWASTGKRIIITEDEAHRFPDSLSTKSQKAQVELWME